MKAVLVNTPKGQFVLSFEQIAYEYCAVGYYEAVLKEVNEDAIGFLVNTEFECGYVMECGMSMNGFNDFNGKMQPLLPDAKWWLDEDNYKVVELDVKVLEPEFIGAQTEVTC